MINIITSTKICSKCEKEFPLTSEYFSSDKRKLDRLQSQCRKCGREAAKKSRQRHPGKIKIRKERFHSQHPMYSTEYDRKYRQTFNGHLRHLFQGLKTRCNNSKCQNYKRYGGRGIKCLFKSSDEFVDYIVDVLKVDPRGLEIHRINNDGHYEPGNIEFLTNIKHKKCHKNRRSQ